MSDNKKYYYLRLKDNFFDTEEMRILESMSDGYTYSNILLKLSLLSLKNEGKLMFRGSLPYSPEMLASILNHDVGNIERAIKIFQQLGFIEILDNGAIFMTDIQLLIGEGSSEGDRKKAYRNRIEEERKMITGHIKDICPPENRDKSIENINNIYRPAEQDHEEPIELEEELVEEKEGWKVGEVEVENKQSIPYKGIVDYLNNKCNTKFKHITKATRRLIKSRINEGFLEEHFREVIDIKSAEWLTNPKMNMYLRPSTLFGSNFESYLNQKNLKSGGSHNDNAKYQQHVGKVEF